LRLFAEIDKFYQLKMPMSTKKVKKISSLSVSLVLKKYKEGQKLNKAMLAGLSPKDDDLVFSN
jgi:energy-coupling factor transporter transmembrane protein EcfT